MKLSGLKLWIVSIFYALFPIYFFLHSVSFELNSFKEFFPSIASFKLVDVSARIALYYKTLILALVSWLVIYLLLKRIYNKFNPKLFWKFLLSTSLIGIACFFIELLTENHFNSVIFILVIQIAYLIHCLHKPILKANIFNSTSYFIWKLSMAIALALFVRAILVFFFNFNSISSFNLYFIVSFIVVSLINLYLVKRSNIVQIIKASFLLLNIPIISVISNEVYIISNQHNVNLISPAFIFLISIIILTGITIWLLKKERDNKPRLSFIINKRVLPILVINILVFIFYTPIIHQSIDMFEMANPANGIMRIFKFNELPFIDFLNSHALWELFFRGIYIVFNGYDGTLAFNTYIFIDKCIFYLACFWFFRSVFINSKYSILLLFFIPFIPHILYQSLYIVIFTTFFIKQLANNYSAKNLVKLFIWTIFVVLWRIDAGFANLLATAIIFIIIFIEQYTSKSIKITLVTGGYIILASVAIVAILSFIFHDSLFLNFKKALSYLGDNQAHGHVKISAKENNPFFNTYFIYPAISLIISVFSILQIFKLKNKTKTLWYVILFFSLVHLFNLPRGLVRHSILTGQDSFSVSFFYLVLILTTYALIPKKQYGRVIVFALALFLVPNLKYKGALGENNLLKLFNEKFSTPIVIKKTKNKISRVIPNKAHEKKAYLAFKSFMDKNFPDTATFIDLSNSPMLYFYLTRPVPSYFCQYMQNTINPYLQEQNLDYIKAFHIPVVVFSHIPEKWFDKTDGVPNTMRYNLITEYVYKNYTPLGKINNYWVWLNNNNTIKDSIEIKTFEKGNPVYNMHMYPYGLFRHFNEGDITCDSTIAVVSDSIISIQSKLNRYQNYLNIKIKQSAKKTMPVSISYGSNKKGGTFNFNTTAQIGECNYLIPLSYQYNWVNSNTNKLEYNIPKRAEIIEAKFLIKRSDN